MKYANIFGWLLYCFAQYVFAAPTTQQKIELFFSDTGKSAGFIVIEETPFGLLFNPSLTGFTPGAHGFHVHEHPSCEHRAMDALGHFDPTHTSRHRGPYRHNGHQGDLPQLFADEKGSVVIPVFAPRLHTIKDIQKRALMIHANPDNYSDYPEKLGGSGARVACGII